VLGIISLLVLPVAIYARYSRQLAGGWRRTYVIAAMISLYINVFVLVAQLFMRVLGLKAMAPTQSEPLFKLTQLVVLVLFVVLTIAAAKKFRNEPGHAA
jgi:ABC-type protease/lipase transport system fused ATPase/permease subunit